MTNREHAEALAAQLGSENRELIGTIERCTETDWAKQAAGDEWSVGVIASHVADGYLLILAALQALVSGGPMPVWTALSRDEADRLQAERVVLWSGSSKDEVMALLRTNGDTAARFVRGLTDEELDRRTPPRSSGERPTIE